MNKQILKTYQIQKATNLQEKEILQLRRQRFDEIAKKEKKISIELFKRYFGYSSSSYMNKSLNETKNLKENKILVNIIENRLNNLIKELKSNPTSDTKTKLKTEIICQKLLILFFTLINKINQGKD